MLWSPTEYAACYWKLKGGWTCCTVNYTDYWISKMKYKLRAIWVCKQRCVADIFMQDCWKLPQNDCSHSGAETVAGAKGIQNYVSSNSSNGWASSTITAQVKQHVQLYRVTGQEDRGFVSWKGQMCFSLLPRPIHCEAKCLPTWGKMSRSVKLTFSGWTSINPSELTIFSLLAGKGLNIRCYGNFMCMPQRGLILGHGGNFYMKIAL